MIEVVSLTGYATVQDGGRPGLMHHGIPPGGALVPELLDRANAHAGNAADVAAIEVLVGSITLKARRALRIGAGENDGLDLAAGETRSFDGSSGRVHYVAARGGIDVPVVLGGRGTLLVASVGGLGGRLLRAGDMLPVGHTPPRDSPPPALPDERAVVRVVPGPDGDRFPPRAIDVLVGSEFVVDARTDRVGMRLNGPSIPVIRDGAGFSTPMVRGAIQVPPSGKPIVLGPDHPTTGGYPVIATVIRAHLGSLAIRRPGTRVCFEIARDPI